MRIATAALTLTLGIAAAAPAQAQNQYVQQIRAQLSRAANTIRSQGYVPAQDMISGNLNQGARESMMVTLNGGTRYAIVGVCDEDCTDVDLRIMGPDGSQLDEDIETDDTPVLEFVAPVTGQYRMMVMMATCSTAPCYWGAQIFQRQ